MAGERGEGGANVSWWLVRGERVDIKDGVDIKGRVDVGMGEAES